jgi:exopolysaccharide biosynthesis polyprenyl glycosylphosphotransferase
MAGQDTRSYRFLAETGLVLADLFVFVLSFVLAFVLVHATYGLWDIDWFSGLDFQSGRPLGMWFVWDGMPFPMWQEFYPYIMTILIPLPLVRLIVMTRLGCYRLEGEIFILEDVIETFRAVTIGSILLIVVAFTTSSGTGEARFVPGRRIFPVDWMLCVAGCISIRIILRIVQRKARRLGRNLTPVILLGKGNLADMIRNEVNRDPTIGYRIVREVPLEGSEPDVRQQLAEIPKLIKDTGAREVFVAGRYLTQAELLPILMKSGWAVNLKVVPDLLGLRPKKVDISRLRYVPLIELFVDPIRGATGTIKRVLDLTVAVAALAVLAIPMLIVAMWIKWDSPGPVFFKQTRMGRDFRPFPMFKFRSMRVDGDTTRHEQFMKRVIQEGRGEVDDETGQPVFKEKEDPRITRIGRFIRKYSIDELPQLFNVIRGDMSIVGPRPPVPYEVAMYREQHLPRMSAKPGITGLWQVSGRNAVSFDEMVRMDITYMENWSILADLKIILQTIPVVLFPRDTY